MTRIDTLSFGTSFRSNAHDDQRRSLLSRLCADLRNVAALLIALLILANGAAVIAAEPLTYYGFDEDAYSAEAVAGLEAIYSGHCFHNGLPTRAIMVLATTRRSSKGQRGLGPGSTKGQFYTNGSSPSPPTRKSGKAPGAGLGNSVFTRNNTMLGNFNCFDCHAGVVHGQVVAGLGNAYINQPLAYQAISQTIAAADQLSSMMGTEAEKKELTDMISFLKGVSANFKFAKTRGDNFGPYPVWRMGANLVDPEHQGMMVGDVKTELSKMFDATQLPPVDPMPWWLMKYKETDYWYADANPYDAAHFSGNFTTPHPEVNENRAEHVKTVAKALALARETKSPPFPGSLNADLVRKGADLFHGRTRPGNTAGFRTCKSCHGTYTKNVSNADLSMPGSWDVSYKYSKILRDVKTDTAYNTVLQKFRPIADHINKLEAYYEAQGTPELTPRVGVPSKPGYVAPPLDGVWATAPYFHNGSVPTIEAVLNSKNPTRDLVTRYNGPACIRSGQGGAGLQNRYEDGV